MKVIFTIESETLTRNPKILFLARWYPDRYDPMPGLFIKRHAETAASFADVAMLYVRAAPEKKYSYELVQTTDNKVFTVIVYYGTDYSLLFPLRKIIAFFAFFRSLFLGYKLIKKRLGTPDILHVNILTRIGIFALLLKVVYGIPYVITEHWSRYLDLTGNFNGFFRKLITRIVVNRASAVSTVSINLAEAMQRNGLKNPNYLILPNVVDTQEYSPKSEQNASEIKSILHVSCFEDKSKNISGILRVLKKISVLRTDFKFVFVGDGIDYEKLKNFYVDLDFPQGLIEFRGLLEGTPLVKSYQECDFLLMFSNYENMPVVISEAFSCGKPVLATRVGGIPEYITPQSGRLVNAADEQALYTTLNEMLDTCRSFDSGWIRNIALKNFSVEAVERQLKHLYSFASGVEGEAKS